MITEEWLPSVFLNLFSIDVHNFFTTSSLKLYHIRASFRYDTYMYKFYEISLFSLDHIAKSIELISRHDGG